MIETGKKEKKQKGKRKWKWIKISHLIKIKLYEIGYSANSIR